ncbi:MAG: TOBE domain-containing protein [Thermoleophilia bacterium]|nr:TOBE domain-containing protein [Thermoleophilia bacterium]
MALSARNQLAGKVKSVVLGAVMAEVVIDIGGQDIVSTITRQSCESLDLKAGDDVRAVIKATEVLIDK